MNFFKIMKEIIIYCKRWNHKLVKKNYIKLNQKFNNNNKINI